jgi:hypothetical protein
VVRGGAAFVERVPARVTPGLPSNSPAEASGRRSWNARPLLAAHSLPPGVTFNHPARRVRSVTVPDDAPLEARLEALHAALAATAERPVETRASRWLGEAEAVAADALAAAEAGQEAVARERTGQVRDLLANVEATGDPVADDRVETARALADAVE